MSRLRYMTRTLVGPWGAVVVAGLEIANLMQRGRPWRGELVWTVDWLGIVFFAAGPVLAGLSAVDAARITRTESLPVLMVSPQPWRAYLHAVAWTAGPASILHLLAFAAAIAMGWPEVASSSVGWGMVGLALLAQVSQFWWYAALGSVLGRFLSPVAAGLMGAVGGLGAFYLLGSGEGFELLAVGGSTVSRLGLTWNGGYLGLQTTLLIGTSMVMIVVIGGMRGRRPRRNGVVAMGILMAVVVAMLFGPQRRILAMEPDPPTECFWGDPVVCVYPEHGRIADTVYAAVYEAVDAARQNGYGFLVSEYVHEVSRVYFPQDADTKGVGTDQLLSGQEWDDFDLIWDLVTPWHCPEIRDVTAPSDIYFESMEALVFTWLTLLDEPADPQIADLPEDLLEERRLDPARARETKASLDTCDF